MACTKKKCGTIPAKDDQKAAILKMMAGSGAPCGCKEIAECCGIDSKSVSGTLKILMSDGYINSPIRCKYGITEAGRTALKASI